MKHLRKAFLVLSVLFGLFSAAPAAAEAKTAAAELNASFRAGSGTVCVEAQDKDAPLPEQSRLHLEEGQTGTFRFAFDSPGEYRYRIRQLEGDEKGVTYDTCVYEAAACVTAAKDGTLTAVLVVKNVSSGNKTDKVTFRNETAVPPAHRTSLLQPVLTGDASALPLYAAGLALAAGLLGVLLYGKEKRHEINK